MKTMVASALLLLLPALLGPQPPESGQSRLLVFTHVSVIDVTGAPPKPDLTVVIAGDRIVLLDSSAKLSPIRETQVIDATGKFLIPHRRGGAFR